MNSNDIENNVESIVQTLEQVQNCINTASMDNLAEQDGMVYQVWQDGEITLQKSGRLLNTRTLHTAEFGYTGLNIEGLVWPHTNKAGNSFLYSDEVGCFLVRIALLTYYKQQLVERITKINMSVAVSKLRPH